MKTRAYIIKKDGTKFWFDIPTETAQKALRLQKMFKEERQKKSCRNNTYRPKEY
jgi:hypothetical protein